MIHSDATSGSTTFTDSGNTTHTVTPTGNTHTDTAINASGGTYVYAAFAEAPFVNSEGVPCNAR